ncbi:MAG TPA: hypothetical protein DCE41_08770 [Cytophagales bacterium]|nr:hypothetical protein [Cytophagales bacterium]HAA20134.1 hypothetical protein [Cytophagales bacterium]HAP59964.1 hypothetical protein [Cytophagales bacterium]
MTQQPKFLWALAALMLCSTFTFGQAKKGDFVTAAMTKSSIGWGGFSGVVARADLGLQGGYMLTDRLEIGVSAQGSLGINGFNRGVIKNWDAGVYGRYYLTEGRWQPYLFGGISYGGVNYPQYTLDGTFIEQFNSNQLRAHIGAGIQYWATENLAIFGELKYQQVLRDFGGNATPRGGLIGPTIGIRWNISGRNRMKQVPKGEL